jgi:hypothetical protein
VQGRGDQRLRLLLHLRRVQFLRLRLQLLFRGLERSDLFGIVLPLLWRVRVLPWRWSVRLRRRWEGVGVECALLHVHGARLDFRDEVPCDQIVEVPLDSLGVNRIPLFLRACVL